MTTPRDIARAIRARKELIAGASVPVVEITGRVHQQTTSGEQRQ